MGPQERRPGRGERLRSQGNARGRRPRQRGGGLGSLSLRACLGGEGMDVEGRARNPHVGRLKPPRDGLPLASEPSAPPPASQMCWGAICTCSGAFSTFPEARRPSLFKSEARKVCGRARLRAAGQIGRLGLLF